MIHATVIGHLGADAESKTLDSGKTVLNMSIATKGFGKDAPTTWVRAALWGERGKKVAEYLKKGTKVAVSGTLSTREYESKGEKRTSLALDVAELELLTPKKSDADEAPF